MINPTTSEIVAALRICSIGHRPCEDCVFDNFDGDISCTQALGKAAADRLEELSRWIPVSERLPEENDEYLVAFNDGYIASVDFIDGDFELWVDAGNVTHWRPLPEPPKEG